MREIRSYGSVGVPAGNRRHYPAMVCWGIEVLEQCDFVIQLGRYRWGLNQSCTSTPGNDR